ncbi:leucyl aminopeptidase [Caulobacter ginsengisoli]|uniref:Probable cytosol aminopeptidase n=1 Tax=Caulobacter ginsengisoli TaxID=400775 RepID=A0ABU0IPX3_9CAUL|nr:leucyl aminopeptidase [Caulobacter ginsengisoli]MDQ0464066.1 leucyl aminopeptidase [Caulobacter ginsengisoli]
MRIEFVAADRGNLPTGGAVGVMAFEEGKLSWAAEDVDKAMSGGLSRAIAAGRFKGSAGQNIELVAPAGLDVQRVIVAGSGKDWNADIAERFAAQVFQAVRASGSDTLTLLLPGSDAEQAARAALGATLAGYRFDRYRTTESADKKTSVATVRVATDDPKAAEAAWAPLKALAEAIAFSRDLVSEPANILYPAEFAKRVKALEPLGLEVEILGEAEMMKLGMGSLLGVGQGSVRDSQLAVIQWKGGGDAQPIAFVGKGVCFDTGGISIKPADGMEDMKWDMGGAAAVAGVMHALAGRKAKVNAVGILGLVENMPDGNAQRPGDVVTSMSGKTIEVINTDAEGRLVLADALWYCQDRFKPQFMVDLATLTGAIIISLGHDYGGLFSNNDELSGKLLKAGQTEGEPLWRMPMPSAYEKQIESAIADVKNTGGRPAGSITAALFLQHFVNGLPWAHLDIASVAWKKPSTNPTIPEGASGYGVRLLNRLVADNYEV